MTDENNNLTEAEAWEQTYAEKMPVARDAIKREFAKDTTEDTVFTAEELEAISFCANGFELITMPKKSWVVVESEEDGLKFKCAEDNVALVKKLYSFVLDIYDKSVDAGIEYVSDYDYVGFVAYILRCMSKFAIYFDEADFEDEDYMEEDYKEETNTTEM